MRDELSESYQPIVMLFAITVALTLLVCGLAIVLAAIRRACWTRNNQRCSVPLALLAIAIFIGAAVFVSVAVYQGDIGRIRQFGGQLAVALAIGCAYAYFPIRIWIGDKLALAKDTPLRAGPSRRRFRMRMPLRSNALGLLLKAIGLAGMLAFWSPLSMPVFTWIDEHASSYNAAYYGGILARFILTSPWAVMLYMGYRLTHSTPLTSQEDTRRPILFLRPFSNDNATTIQPRGMLPTLCGLDKGINRYGNQASERGKLSMLYLWTAVHPIRVLRLMLNRCVDSAEESLVRFFAKLAPVYAIGKPGEFLPTPGAHRLYPGEEWQSVVLDFLSRAQAVIVQPGTSDGVMWELNQIRQRVPYYRILLSLVAFKRNPEGYERLRHALWESWGTKLPRSIPFKKNQCFVWLDENWQPIVQEISYSLPLTWPFTGDSIDLPYTLHPFIQGMHGGDREPPRKVRWCDGLAYYSIFIPTALLAFIVGFLPGEVLRVATNLVQWQLVDDGLSSVPDTIAESTSEPTKPHLFENRTEKYFGKTIDYSFTLDSKWKQHAASKPTEYLFRSDDAAFETMIFPGTSLIDLYDEDFPEAIRKVVETRVQQDVPFAKVELLEDKWVSLNGTQWRSLTFSQSVNLVLNERRVSLYTAGDAGAINTVLIVPNKPSSIEMRNQILQSLHAPESHLDKIIKTNSAASKTVHLGKRANYKITLNDAWSPTDSHKTVTERRDASEALRESLSATEHLFILGSPIFAMMEIDVVDLGAEDQIETEQITAVDCEDILATRIELLKTLSKKPVSAKLLNHRIVDKANHKWLEFNAVQETQHEDRVERVKLTFRLICLPGKLISVTAEIKRDHPAIRTMVDEALESFEFVE